MPIYLDANLADADWTKRSWDLPTDTAYWAEQRIENLQAFVELPAFKAAPAAIRKLIEERLAAEL